MPINDHLTITLPEPVYITVNQVLGYAKDVTIPASLLPIIKDANELSDCIQAAAMNNYKSITNESGHH